MFVLYAVAVSTVPLAALPAIAKSVRLADERMTFMLPNEWTAIPQNVIAKYNTGLERALSEPHRVDFKYGYQISGADEFDYPYILVKNGERYKITEAIFQDLPTVDMNEAFRKGMDQARGLLPPGSLGSLSFQKLAFDPATHKMWSEGKATTDCGVEVRGLIMMQPTEDGVTDFYFYAASEQYLKLKPLFLKVALSVTPDPEIAYRPDDYNWQPIISAGIKGLLLVTAFSFYRRFFGRSKPA